MVPKGNVHAQVIPNTSKKPLQGIIDELAQAGISIISDCWEVYNDVHKNYLHETVAHHIGQYVNERGFHTNTLEGFWNILKVSQQISNFAMQNISHVELCYAASILMVCRYLESSLITFYQSVYYS